MKTWSEPETRGGVSSCNSAKKRVNKWLRILDLKWFLVFVMTNMTNMAIAIFGAITDGHTIIPSLDFFGRMLLHFSGTWSYFLWVLGGSTIWLFNIAMENPPIFKNGKPSISMGHLYHGELLVITCHNQRVYMAILMVGWYVITTLESHLSWIMRPFATMENWNIIPMKTFISYKVGPP